MLTLENYQFTWQLYILASFGAVAVFWRMISKLRWAGLKLLLCLSLASLLLTPIQADPEQAFLAPAFLVCALETIFEGTESTARAGIPLLVSWLGVLLLSVILSTGCALYRRYKQAREKRGHTA
jgi:hypothetical protein